VSDIIAGKRSIIMGAAIGFPERDRMPPSGRRPFEARYAAYDFQPGLINRSGSLTFTTDDLAHALFVTGRAPGDQSSYGAASVWEFMHRTSLIPAYLRRNRTGRLVRSRLARELDRSEKVALSYALGQALSGVFCRQLLAVRFLMHIDRYGDRYNMQFGGTRKRADLFGQGPSGWLVVESKGRSNSMESDLRTKLTAQKRSVVSIGGRPPDLALGCVASFPPAVPGLRVDAFDPEPGEVEPIAIQLDFDRYVLAYYEPFVAALDAGNSTVDEAGSTPFISADFQPFGLRVGLLRAIEQRVRTAIQGEVAGLAQDILSILGERFRADNADGTLVETDWEQSLSIDDWEY
jgi:hypothetical protein